VLLAAPGLPQAAANFNGRGDYRRATLADDAAEEPMAEAPPPPPPPPSPGAPPAKTAEKAKDEIVATGSAAKPTGTPAAGNNQPAIKVRTDFNALAVFAPAVATDAQGHATVPVKLPDNLTRYRVMAIAVARDKEFGAGESTITARLPLMVRPSAPRFLNFGDKFEFPVVLQNQTDKPMQVDVAMRATNAELTDGHGRRVTVPANDRVEVRFPTSAVKAGTARFQVAAIDSAAGGTAADAHELSLPVWTPATTEAFATYGVIDEGATAQPVKMPSGVFPQFGGLEITTSSTALQALTDAVLYLTRYPYECSEQMSDRIMAVAGLRDVLTAFAASGLPSPEAMEDSVKHDVEMLRRLQNDDGGWAFWKHDDDSWPFLTVHVTHALLRAKEKKYDVPKETIDRAMPYLKDIDAHIPAWYPPEVRWAIDAYAIYVRNRNGDADPNKAMKIVADAGGLEKLPIEAVAWIYPTVTADPKHAKDAAALRTFVGNRVEEQAGSAHFVSSYGDGDYLMLHSDRRVDSIFLEDLIGDQPKNDVIPKLVEGLLGHKTAGHWESTQEDSWVLLGLDRYFNTYEKATPDYVARAWLGTQYAGDHAFKGHTTERFDVDIPMQYLAASKDQTQDLVLQRDGKAGRLYYRIGMQYAPTDLKLPPADYGFTVTRAYEPIDKKDDVVHQPDGSWLIKAGARVRVRINMVAEARRYHVALVDPIPAGLEAQNPALATTGTIPQDPKDQQANGYWMWMGPWYEHQNMRDERVEAFTSLLWDGVYDYSYVARATTPGEFVVPPSKAEEMYHPEVFGRSAGDKVIVK
jgi:uncharacterized protein YfaS (alpha-2-macroglobulin family)